MAPAVTSPLHEPPRHESVDESAAQPGLEYDRVLRRKASFNNDSGVAGLDLHTSPAYANSEAKLLSSRLEIVHPTPESPLLPSHTNIQMTEESTNASPTTFYGQLKRDRPLLVAGVNFAALFAVSFLALFLILRALLPPIEPDDAPYVKIPKSFEDLQNLNKILQIYKTSHFGRVLSSFVVVYLFLQTFSLPGSMYLSILGGAMYGLWALPLVCFCVATGATFCYFLSMLLGPALLAASAKWRNRVAQWTERIAAQGDNLISYLIVLRIAPLPPHWVVNVVAPHLGIDIKTFWISTFLGIFGATYIHVSIGQGLDQMTSSADFKLLSIGNLLGLGGIVVAVLAPVAIRYIWKKELDDAAGEAVVGEIMLPPSDEDMTLSSVKKNTQLVFLDSNDQPLPPRSIPRSAFKREAKDADAEAEFRKQERRAGSELAR